MVVFQIHWGVEMVIFIKRILNFVGPMHRSIKVVGHYAIILAVVAFYWDWGDRETDRAVRRVTMLATIVQVAGTARDRETPNPVVPILETLAREKMDLSSLPLPKANLSGAKLNGANLVGANLREAKLFEAKLIGADLSEADLNTADLRQADLSNANLRGADLITANLSNANLSEADLSGAYLMVAVLFGASLSGADLSGADLSGATLTLASLSGADLSLADLIRANLSLASLSGADLSGVKNLTQDQLEAVRPTSPPKSLPDGLTWPFVEKDGKWMKEE